MLRSVPVALIILLVCLSIALPNSNAHSRKHHGNWHQLTDAQQARHLSKIKKKRWDRRHSDFHKALKFSSWYWGVSYDWLHNCAHDEGGHGPKMIWNLAGSSAYGMMQYMPGTYLGFASSSFREGKKRGLNINWKMFYNKQKPQGRPDTLFGQAFSAAWAFKNEKAWHWEGSAC